MIRGCRQLTDLLFLLKKAISAFFLVIVVWILYLAGRLGIKLFHTSFLVMAGCLLLAVTLLCSRVIPCVVKMPEASQRILIVTVMAAAFLLMMKTGYSLRVDVFETWDYGQLVRTAFGIVRGDGTIDVPYYYARYPNNGMFLLILTAYFRVIRGICGDDIYRYVSATIPLNSLLLILSCFFTYLAVSRLRGSAQGIVTAALMLVSLPLYGYAAIAYTDVFGMLPAALTLYFYAQAKTETSGKRKTGMLCLAAAVSVLGYFIKASLIILTIALFLDLLFESSHIRRKLISSMAVLLTCAVCISAGDRVTDHFLIRHGVSESLMEEQEFPVTHWIMMSLNLKSGGGYVAKDVTYTSSFEGKAAKREADLKKIRARIRRRGAAGTLKHLFYTKVNRMWACGTFASDDYLARRPLTEGEFREFFARNRKYNRGYYLITQLVYVVMLVMMAGYAVRALRRRDRDASVFPELAVTGVFLFHVLWECNNRYVFVFLPILAAATDKLVFLTDVRIGKAGRSRDCKTKKNPVIAK